MGQCRALRKNKKEQILRKIKAMNESTQQLLKRTEGLSLSYRFFWRFQYGMLGFFGPPDNGPGGGPRGALLRERLAKVESFAQQQPPLKG